MMRILSKTSRLMVIITLQQYRAFLGISQLIRIFFSSLRPFRF